MIPRDKRSDKLSNQDILVFNILIFSEKILRSFNWFKMILGAVKHEESQTRLVFQLGYATSLRVHRV